MTSTAKLAMTIPDMRERFMFWCHHLTALHRVALTECVPSRALEAVTDQVERMHVQVKAMCGAYDLLRSLMGALEREQGVKEPRFYVDHHAGSTVKAHCPRLCETSDAPPPCTSPRIEPPTGRTEAPGCPESDFDGGNDVCPH